MEIEELEGGSYVEAFEQDEANGGRSSIAVSVGDG